MPLAQRPPEDRGTRRSPSGILAHAFFSPTIPVSLRDTSEAERHALTVVEGAACNDRDDREPIDVHSDVRDVVREASAILRGSIARVTQRELVRFALLGEERVSQIAVEILSGSHHGVADVLKWGRSSVKATDVLRDSEEDRGEFAALHRRLNEPVVALVLLTLAERGDRRAAEALIGIADDATVQFIIKEIYEAMTPPEYVKDPRDLSLLPLSLNRSLENIRRAYLPLALHALNDLDAVVVLRQAVQQDYHPRLGISALEALAGNKDPLLADCVLERLYEPLPADPEYRWLTRRAAAYSLQQSLTPEIQTTLLGLLTRPFERGSFLSRLNDRVFGGQGEHWYEEEHRQLKGAAAIALSKTHPTQVLQHLPGHESRSALATYELANLRESLLKAVEPATGQ